MIDAELLWIIAFAVEIIILCVAAYIGWRSSFLSCLVRTAYLLIISILSYVIASICAPKISGLLIDWVCQTDIELINSICMDSPETVKLCQMVISPYITALMFPAIFIIFELLSLIKFSFVSNKIINKIKTNVRPCICKLLGAVVGFVNGLMVVSVVLIPLCLFGAAMGTSNELTNNSPNDSKYVYSSNILIPASISLNNITNINVSTLPQEYIDIFEKDINMTAEAKWLTNAVKPAMNAYTYAIQRNMSSKEAVFCALGAVNEVSGESEVIPAIFMRIIFIASEKWGNDQEFIGVKLQANNKLASSLISETLKTLSNTTKDNVKSTVRILMGNGYDKGVLNNILILSAIKDESTDSSVLNPNTQESVTVLAETLISFGKDDDFKEITDSVSNDIRNEFADETREKLFPEGTSDKDKMGVASTLVEEINIYDKSQGDVNDAYDYETCVNNVADYIMEVDGKYNYEATKSEALIVAVSLVSYMNSTDNISVEGVLEYFGFSNDEIYRIIHGT